MPPNALDPGLPTVGDVFAGRYRVEVVMQGGAHSRVYRAVDLEHHDRKVAVKVEELTSSGRALLRSEADVLQRVLRGGLGIPQVVDFVQNDPVAKGNMLVLELLGEDLRMMLQRQHRISPPTAAYLGLQMLDAIQFVHERGLIHRDVKPGNFVFGRKSDERLKVYLIDFGLVRRHLENGNRPRRPRERAAFRGTTHYASIAAQTYKDLGRVDDLWSLVFLLMEMVGGRLPWDGLYKRGLKGDAKEQAKRRLVEEKKRLLEAGTHADPHAIHHLQAAGQYLDGLPFQLVEALRMLAGLRYESRPDYTGLRSLFLSMGRGSIKDARMFAEREILGLDISGMVPDFDELDSSRGSGESRASASDSSGDEPESALVIDHEGTLGEEAALAALAQDIAAGRGPVCINGHALKEVVTQSSLTCESCDSKFCTGTPMHSCKECYYHLCSRCWRRESGLADEEQVLARVDAAFPKAASTPSLSTPGTPTADAFSDGQPHTNRPPERNSFIVTGGKDILEFLHPARQMASKAPAQTSTPAKAQPRRNRVVDVTPVWKRKKLRDDWYKPRRMMIPLKSNDDLFHRKQAADMKEDLRRAMRFVKQSGEPPKKRRGTFSAVQRSEASEESFDFNGLGQLPTFEFVDEDPPLREVEGDAPVETIPETG